MHNALVFINMQIVIVYKILQVIGIKPFHRIALGRRTAHTAFYNIEVFAFAAVVAVGYRYSSYGNCRAESNTAIIASRTM